MNIQNLDLQTLVQNARRSDGWRVEREDDLLSRLSGRPVGPEVPLSITLPISKAASQSPFFHGLVKVFIIPFLQLTFETKRVCILILSYLSLSFFISFSLSLFISFFPNLLPLSIKKLVLFTIS